MSEVASIPGKLELHSSRWGQIAAWGGAIFAVLLVAGYVLQGLAGSGVEDESRAAVVARYSDNANELSAELGGLVLGFAVVFSLPFLASLRAALRRVEGERQVLSVAAVAGGGVMATLFLASSAVTVAAFSTYDFFDAYEVDPDAVLLLQSLSFYMQGFALVGGAVLVGATSIVALKTRLLPRSLAVSGLVLSAVLVFGIWAMYIVVPLPLLALWVLVVSVILVARERRALASPREP